MLILIKPDTAHLVRGAPYESSEIFMQDFVE